MAKWINLPQDKIISQPDQLAFLAAKRRRHCKTCKTEYQCPPNLVCPTCQVKGIRLFDRLTIIAGRRFGKTLFGSIAAAEEATIPYSTGWATCPTFPKLHRYVIPAFQKLIPSEWVSSWSGELLDLRLKNGALIHFQSLDEIDAGRGQGLDWLYCDEVCELTEDHWNVLSPSLADKQGVAFFTTSPRSYDWVYDRLYQPAVAGVPGYWGLHARTADNPIFHTPEGIAYLARAKAEMPDLMYRQEYEADFVTFEGAVYGSLLDTQVVRTTEQIRQLIPEWPDIASWRQVLVGIDTGADHPFGATKLVSTEKGLVCVGEYLERHRTFVEHAGSIKMLAGNGNTKYAINKNERQPMIELAQHGMYCQPAENDVVAGIERVKSWLHQKQLWFVEPLCPMTIKSLKAYRWAPDKMKDGQVRKERVYKHDDELCDCFVAGTHIQTNTGNKPVEDVNTGDLVLTRKGYFPVTATGSRYVDTHKLALSNGNCLIGTATHPIWVEGQGFKDLTSLRYGDMLWTCTQTITALGLERFGKDALVQSLPSTTFTTKTVINLTTPWITWSASLVGRISASICSLDRWWSNLVGGAENLLLGKTLNLAFVPTPVSQLGAGTLAWTTKNASARNVAPLLFVTNTLIHSTAPGLVEQEITNVPTLKSSAKNAGIPLSNDQKLQDFAVTVVGSVPTGKRERVYNLSVDACPEYFANGILVHNCLRYSLQTWPMLPLGPPAPTPQKRDLSGLPDEMRGTIERMRRIDSNPKEEREEMNVVGDYFSSAWGGNDYVG